MPNAPTIDQLEEELKAIGEPGKNQQEKIDFVKKNYPNASNPQGIKLHTTLEAYRNF